MITQFLRRVPARTALVAMLLCGAVLFLGLLSVASHGAFYMGALLPVGAVGFLLCGMLWVSNDGDGSLRGLYDPFNSFIERTSRRTAGAAAILFTVVWAGGLLCLIGLSLPVLIVFPIVAVAVLGSIVSGVIFVK